MEALLGGHNDSVKRNGQGFINLYETMLTSAQRRQAFGISDDSQLM